MQKHNRLITIFMLLLMVTWYAPMVINDNIASATLYYNHSLKLISSRYDLGYSCFGVGYNGVFSDGDFVYVASDLYTGGYIASKSYDGLLIYNATSHNILTSINHSSTYYYDVWVNGNYVFVCNKGIDAFYFNYIDDDHYTLTYLSSINSSTPLYFNHVTGDSNYIYATSNDSTNAYSFDYGGSNTFTWLGKTIDAFRGICLSGSYIFLTHYWATFGISVYTFDGANFNFVTNKTSSILFWNVWVDQTMTFIYVSARTSLNVYSFDGATLTFEYTRSDIDIPALNEYDDVTGDNYYVYFACRNGGVFAYTKYDGYAMTLLDHRTDGGYVDWSCYNVYSDGTYCYATYEGNGLKTYYLTPIVSPTMTTKTATGVGTTYATLPGEINYNGGDNFDTYGFQYGLTTSYEKGYLQSTNINETLNLQDIEDASSDYLDVSADRNGNVFTACSSNGLRAYTYNGDSFTLKDTASDGGSYQGLWTIYNVGYSRTYIFVANYASGIRAYSYNVTGLSLLATTDDGGEYYNVVGEFNNFLSTSVMLYVACGSSGLRAYQFYFGNSTFVLRATRDDSAQDYVDVTFDNAYIFTTCLTAGIKAYTYSASTLTPHGSDYVGIGSYHGVTTKKIKLDGVVNKTYIFVACGSLGVLEYLFTGGGTFTPNAYRYDGGTYYDVWVQNITDDDYYYPTVPGQTPDWKQDTYVYCACGVDGLRAYLFINDPISGLTFIRRGTRYDGAGGAGNEYLSVSGDIGIIYATMNNSGVCAYTKTNNGSYSYYLAGLSPDTIYHYRAFSNNTYETGYGADRILYTSATTGIPLDFNINVYNESNGSQGIPFNILIKNLNGTQTYSLMNQQNTLHLNTSSISGNQTILIKVWSENYRERIIMVAVGDHLEANYSFFLPRELLSPGADPGGASAYSPDSPIVATAYNIRVVYTIKSDYQEFDRPIRDALVTIRRFINSSGTYETMSILLTDTNGYANVFLLPSVLYVFEISAPPRFHDLVADWNPIPINAYQVPEVKTFRLELIDYEFQPGEYDYLMENITWSFSPDNTQYTGAIPFSFHIVSSDGQLQWYRMTVEFYNVSNKTWVMLYNGNASTSTGGYLNYTTPNITGQYRVECFFKKAGYPEYELFQMGSLHYAIIFLKAWLKQIPDFVWYLVIIVIMIMVMGFCYVRLGTGIITGYIGLGIMAFGLVMKPGMVINGFPVWGIFATTFILYTMALFLWSRI